MGNILCQTGLKFQPKKPESQMIKLLCFQLFFFEVLKLKKDLK